MTELFRERLLDRWPDIFRHLGLPAKILNKKNQPCPMCGGTDRFRFTNQGGGGSWICTHCGAGDGVTLVMKIKKWGFARAKAEIEPVIGTAKVQPRKEPNEFTRRRALNGLWASGTPITSDTPAGQWLIYRTGITEFPDAMVLRAVASMRWWDSEHGAKFFPGMIAMVTEPNGKPVNIYRTWLTPEGRKAPINPMRKMMQGPIPPGSAVRLWPASVEMGVGEGIETCISASIRHDYVPTWALLGTAGMSSFIPPPAVKRLFVFGDNDLNYAGQAAAYAMGHRLGAVTDRKFLVDVRIPYHVTAGEDWNDVHRPRRGDFD